MDGLKAAAILALLALSCNAKVSWKQVIPEGKEVIYEYSALVKAGTHEPHEFASQFLLEGTLHLQSISDYELLVRLDNLKYDTENGRVNEFKETKFISSDLTDVVHSFKISYETNGTVKQISVAEHEPEYSLNMKKAIAATLQINWEKVPLDSVEQYAFSSKEKSLFGHDSVLYSIYPETKTLKIHKRHHMSEIDHLYENEISDFVTQDCEIAYEEPLTHDSQKLYVVDRTHSNQYILKYMETTGGVYLHQMQGESNPFYVYMNQTFNMLKIQDATELPPSQNEHKHDTLKYIVTEKSFLFENISNPRDYLPKVKVLLKELAEFIKEEKIADALPNFHKEQLTNSIIYTLYYMETQHLEELYNDLKSKTTEDDLLILKIYEKLIPMIGTSSTLKFILKLVQENKFESDVAVDMLQSMAFYVKFPTEQLITELDGMVHLSNVSYSVQKASILSYASLLHKLYHFNFKHEIHSDGIFIKYIELFVKRLTTSKKLEEKYLYFDALYNMKNDLVIKYLEPLIKSKWSHDNILTYKAMTSLSSVLIKPINHDKMYDIYWPIFTDRLLPSYMRIMAFNFMMKSRPNLSYQINIYSFMASEKDPDLLSFYYTLLETLSHSKNPCLYKLKLEAKQILIYWPVSYIHNITGYYKFDVINWKYNYGQGHDIALINTKEALVFFWKLNTYYMNHEYNDKVFYIRVIGLDRQLLDNINLNTQKGMKYFNYEDLFKVFGENPDKLQIDIVRISKGQVVETAFFDKNNIEDFKEYYKIFFDKSFNENKKTLDIHYDLVVYVPIMTDIGFPVFLDARMPSIHETTTKWHKDVSAITTINVDVKYRIMNYHSYGFSFYNPFTSAWQGIRKYLSSEVQIPIYLDAVFNYQQNSLKLSWKKHKDQSQDVVGFKSYVKTFVFVKDYFQHQSKPLDEQVPVTYDDEYKHNVTLLDSELHDLGHKYMLKLLNDVNPKYYLDFSSYDDYWLSSTKPLVDEIMDFLSFYMYLQFQFDVYERGVYFKVEPITDVSSLDLTIRFSHELGEKGHSLYQPPMKANLGVLYSVMKDTEVKKSWNLNAALDLNSGHTVNSLKLEITRHKPEEHDYKTCIQSRETYSLTNLTNTLTVSMGPSSDGKCNKNGTLIQFKMLAERSSKQYQNLHNYEICEQPVVQSIFNLKPYECYAERSSLRDYHIDIETTKLTTEWKHLFLSYWTQFLAEYYSTYNHTYVTSEDIPENTQKLKLHYPISKDIMYAELITPEEIHEFQKLYVKDFSKFGIYPDNLLYGHSNYLTHLLGLSTVCTIDNNDLKNYVTDDWILLLADSEPSKIKHGIWIKLVDGAIAIKSTFEEHTLVITPHIGIYKITLDGSDLHVDESYYHEYFGLSKMRKSNVLVYFDKYYGSKLIYNGKELLLEIPKVDVKLYGKCFQHGH